MLREHRLEAAWVLFALANAVAMVLLPDAQAVPFHLIWTSFVIVYGLRTWRTATTAAVLVAVASVTGAILALTGDFGSYRLNELAEVPLMSAMFLAMVWHVRRRRHDALGEARAAAARERRFLSDASHQLRTPITVARGHAELIRNEHAGTQTGRDAQVVLTELERLGRAAERLLLLATAEQPAFLLLQPVDVDDLVRDAARRWGAVADRAWEVSARAGGSVPGDRERLDEALDALLENAVHATARGERIALEARAEGGDAVVVVADEGRGIPPEQLERVFERFVRLGGGDEGRRRGSGLGLPIVHAVVTAHGGEVRAEPGRVQGSAVTLRLPGLQARPTPAPRPGGSLAAGAASPEA